MNDEKAEGSEELRLGHLEFDAYPFHDARWTTRLTFRAERTPPLPKRHLLLRLRLPLLLAELVRTRIEARK